MFDLPNSPFLDLPVRSYAEALAALSPARRAAVEARKEARRRAKAPRFMVRAMYVNEDTGGCHMGAGVACHTAAQALARASRLELVGACDGAEILERGPDGWGKVRDLAAFRREAGVASVVADYPF